MQNASECVRVLGLHVAELDVAVQPPPHRDEAAAGLDHTVRFVDQHAHARESAREDELLQRLEEVVVIVDLRLEVVRENSEPAICEANYLDDGGAYIFDRGQTAGRRGFDLLARFAHGDFIRLTNEFT
jgi:hypothetical protein